MLPKSASAEDIRLVDSYMSGLGARLGVENAYAIASASTRVKALGLGREEN